MRDDTNETATRRRPRTIGWWMLLIALAALLLAVLNSAWRVTVLRQQAMARQARMELERARSIEAGARARQAASELTAGAAQDEIDRLRLENESLRERVRVLEARSLGARP